MTTVDSSNIKAVDYNKDTKVLTIVFNSGSTYDYHETSPEEYLELMAADSLGKHFHKHIKSKKFTKK